jgi:predicted DsbA family dithiol-disulfide isomerase
MWRATARPDRVLAHPSFGARTVPVAARVRDTMSGMNEIGHVDDDTRVQLEVWSDVACPWCYVGRRNLAVAIADLDEPDRPEVIWRAFQLDETLPDDGVDAEAYYLKKFGPDMSGLDEARERLIAIGEELGIDFRFDRQRVISNTGLVHRALKAATDIGEHEPVMDAVFAGFFERGVDLGDADALRELIAVELDDEQVAAALVERAQDDPSLVERVHADITTALELQITGVPCFVADRAIAVPGAVPPTVLAQLLAEAAERRHATSVEG